MLCRGSTRKRNRGKKHLIFKEIMLFVYLLVLSYALCREKVSLIRNTHTHTQILDPVLILHRCYRNTSCWINVKVFSPSLLCTSSYKSGSTRFPRENNFLWINIFISNKLIIRMYKAELCSRNNKLENNKPQRN